MLGWSDRVGTWVDEVASGSRRTRGGSDPRIERMGQEERVARLEALAATYRAEGVLGSEGFLRPGGPIAPEERRVLTPLGPATDLRWPSGHEVHHAALAEAYASSRRNRTARARLFQVGDRPRPAVVVVHGYGAGHWPLEQLLWPVRRWLRAGLDVVLPALPFHGKRSEPGRPFTPRFPASDPRFTHEGFRQAVGDLGALAGWLRLRGHPTVGLAGMSLGGYTSALLATVLPGLSFATLVIPLGSLADFARDQGRLGDGEGAVRLHAALEAALWPTSPLARPPRLAPSRVRIVAARGDRITGVAQAERLGAHFGAPVEVCGGSHLLQRLPWGSVVSWTAERAREAPREG